MAAGREDAHRPLGPGGRAAGHRARAAVRHAAAVSRPKLSDIQAVFQFAVVSMRLGNSIFRKLLLSAILLIFASLLIMDFYLTRYTADRQREAVEQQLAAQARV